MLIVLVIELGPKSVQQKSFNESKREKQEVKQTVGKKTQGIKKRPKKKNRKPSPKPSKHKTNPHTITNIEDGNPQSTD